VNKRVYDKAAVSYRGQIVCLNTALIEKNKVSKKAVRKILSIHCDRLDLFVEFIKATGKPRKLRGLVKELERIEYRLQEQWNFKKDKRFHCWWYNAPGCLCPQMDNKELFGTDLRITQSNCPLHGKHPRLRTVKKVK